ncbi:MAG: selenocysteine-specific translation elongation factor [Woeseia sp.]
MTAQLTLGVIGHVDHGKTALVRALTGIDTDRLKEEKDRGLSIVLGFSYLQGARGTIDLIDVPGHENFVRTMISGATGIDGALLVVAANEAIMPQTREHMDIAQLLGVDRGVIVITKQDLVSTEQLALAIEEVRSFVAGTFLEDADLVCASAVTNEGMHAIRRALDRLEPVEVHDTGIAHPFLPVDRAFVMRGFGPVVTGTLRGGELTAHGRVELLPRKLAVTIRGLQVHNRAVERATPGQRVAVNLRHIKREEIKRGDVLASRGCIEASRRIDVELRLLESHRDSLHDSATVRFLAGTSEVMARVRLLDRERLEPGATAFAQLRFQRDLTTYQTQRFIIRSYSPMRTIGGGRVLDAHPERHRRFDARVTGHLMTSARGGPVEKARMFLAEAGLAGTTLDALSDLLGLDPGEVDSSLAAVGPVSTDAGKLVDCAAYSKLNEAILVEMGRYHETHPNHQGIAAAKLRSILAIEPAEDVFRHAISRLISDARIEDHGGILRLVGFDPLVGLTHKERRLAAEMEEAFRMRRLAPTYPDQVVGPDKVRRDLFKLLCDTDRLVRLRTHDRKSDFVVHAEIFDNAVAEIETHFAYPQKFTVSEVRELLGANRKFTVPLMEHLDATGVTIRMGNLRQLRTHHN